MKNLFKSLGLVLALFAFGTGVHAQTIEAKVKSEEKLVSPTQEVQAEEKAQASEVVPTEKKATCNSKKTEAKSCCSKKKSCSKNDKATKD